MGAWIGAGVLLAVGLVGAQGMAERLWERWDGRAYLRPRACRLPMGGWGSALGALIATLGAWGAYEVGHPVLSDTWVASVVAWTFAGVLGALARPYNKGFHVTIACIATLLLESVGFVTPVPLLIAAWCWGWAALAPVGPIN